MSTLPSESSSCFVCAFRVLASGWLSCSRPLAQPAKTSSRTSLCPRVVRISVEHFELLAATCVSSRNERRNHFHVYFQSMKSHLSDWLVAICKSSGEVCSSCFVCVFCFSVRFGQVDPFVATRVHSKMISRSRYVLVLWISAEIQEGAVQSSWGCRKASF